jgi:hypothetical protein
MSDLRPAMRPDLFGQLAATDPHQRRARRLFERGQVAAVSGNEADVLVGSDAQGNALELKSVPIASGYVPRAGDWVAIQYEAGHSGAPWVVGPSMAEDASGDPVGIGVFAISATEPAGPQKSMIYFDDTRGTWVGWDGSTWVDFFAKYHNTMPDLQGGTASQYYHFSSGEHDSLQDFIDGSYLASGYLKRLNFKAIDASGTSRTRLFEKDGDFFWAINAEYDAGNNRWNRLDTAKYAYLIGLYSKNGIPHEPGSLGGVAWWRVTPGSNPVGDYTAVGGWELGFMMTQHRNYVMGGMNLELDGSGSPPYGRFTQIGSEDASVTGGLTVFQRNAWYEGSGSWGRDTTNASAATGFDANGDMFVWWYPEAAEGNAPWTTPAWQRRGLFHLSGDTRGRLDVIRSTSESAAGRSAFFAKHKTSVDMVDGFGAGYAFALEDNAGIENTIAAIYAVRSGADSTGRFSWQLATAGALAERMGLTAAGVLSISGASMSFAGNALSVEAASAVNQDLTTDASPTFLSVQAVRNAGTASFLAYAYSDTATDYPRAFVYRARGASGSPAAVLLDDHLGRIGVYGYDGATWRAALLMQVRAAENWSTGPNWGSYVDFVNYPPGTNAAATSLRLKGGQVLFADGSAGAPGVGFINAADKGWYHGGAGILSGAVAGVEQVRILAAGVLDLRNAGGALRVNGTNVLGARITGWSTPAGTAARANSGWNADTITATDANLRLVAKAVKALVDDLMSHGAIGA